MESFKTDSKHAHVHISKTTSVYRPFVYYSNYKPTNMESSRVPIASTSRLRILRLTHGFLNILKASFFELRLEVYKLVLATESLEADDNIITFTVA